MARVRLDRRALRIARIPSDAPLLLRLDAWGSDVDLPDSEPDEPPFIAEGVALLTVEGPLSREPVIGFCAYADGYGGEDGIAARFSRAVADPDTQAVLIRFRSPGGTSSGLEECVQAMVKARDAAGKPVLGFIHEACSAALWIAAVVCDGGLFGGERAEIGSVGSYIVHWEESEALKMDGYRATIVADPPGKVAGNSLEPLSEVGRARLEKGVKGCTSRFVAATAEGLSVSEKDLRALDGDVLEGVEAVDAGLLDAIADLETTVSLAMAMADERAGAPQ